MKKSPSLDGDGRPKLKPNSFPPLKLKTAHSVSLASFGCFEAGQYELPNESYSPLALNFEVLKPHFEKGEE